MRNDGTDTERFDPIVWRDALMARLPTTEEMLASVEEKSDWEGPLAGSESVRINRIGGVKIRQGDRKWQAKRRGF